nr:hypothetical protein [Tanacetum cinerariifolium]
TIDETPHTITEDLVRSQLQLADDGGIDDLPIAKIYSGMDNLGYVIEEAKPLGGSFHISPPRSSQAPPTGQTSGGAEDLITLTALRKSLGRKRLTKPKSKLHELDLDADDQTFIKVVSNEDFEDEAPLLWSDLVGWKYYENHPVAGAGLILWGDLQVLFDSHEGGKGSFVWHHQHLWQIRSWRLYTLSNVYVLETIFGEVVYMFADVPYPLSVKLMERMLKQKLEIDKDVVGNDMTTAEQLIQVFNSSMLHLLRVEMVINSPWIMPILGTKELASPEQTALAVVPKYFAGSRFPEDSSMYVVPTGRVVVPTGRYVVPAGNVIIVSPGSKDLSRVGSDKVYMMQPPGFQDSEFPERVYKVEKAMHGLHQAPRAWYGTLSKDFEAIMHEKFQMSVMGELTLFLGLQVLQKTDGIFLSQDKYVGDILKKFGYLDVRSANTLMDKENPWGKDGPECHPHAVKRIFRHLKGHPKLGLWYPKESPFDLVAYSDSDYGGATQDRKSTTREYVAAASGYGQVLWIQNQMLDYGY